MDKSVQDEIDRIAWEYQNNFSKYAPNCLKIQSIEGKLLRFKENEVQTILKEIIQDVNNSKRLVRIVLLKARREGVTSWWAGKSYQKTTHNYNRYAMIITHEPEATDFIFSMVKRFQTHCPPEFKPAEKYNNKKILEFNNDSGTGLDSAIRVGTAGKEDFGSAQLIHYLLISELAKFPRHIESALLTSLFQCVPDIEDTWIVLESTGKGIGGEFYDRFWSARYHYTIFLNDKSEVQWKCEINKDASPENIFSAVFIPWFVFPKYEMDVPEGFKRTEDEELLAKLYNLNDRKLAWRRWAIENKCNGSLDTFSQEYPACSREAFLSSGRPVFDTKKCELLMRSAPKPVARYEIAVSNGAFISKKDDGRFLVWQEPTQNKTYVLSADVAEGLEKGDFSCCDVIEQLTGIQVAHWHGKIVPDQFAIILSWIGNRYNTAWLVPERNNHGLLVVTKLRDLRYPRLYVEKVIEPPHDVRMRYGWVTTKASKFPIIDNLAAEIRNNTHYIQCAETFKEMLSFQQGNDGELEAESGMFDDRVMSIAIAKYVRTRLPLPKIQSSYRPNTVTQEKPVSALGWT